MHIQPSIAEEQQRILLAAWSLALTQITQDPDESDRAYHRRVAQGIQGEHPAVLGGWSISRILHGVGVNQAPQQLAPLTTSSR